MVRSSTGRGVSTHRAVRRIVLNFRELLASQAMAMDVIPVREIRATFSMFACYNKFQSNALLAHWFAELKWKLPSKRKAWHSEDGRQAIFDAAAAAATFLMRDQRI